MTIGPVEYLIVGFPSNDFTGAIAPALANLIESKTIRVLDLVFVAKGDDGIVVSFEFDQLEELAPFAALDGEVGGIVSGADIAHAAVSLAPNTSAVVLVWEDTWATEFSNAVHDAGGVLLEGGRIPHDVVEEVLAELPAPV